MEYLKYFEAKLILILGILFYHSREGSAITISDESVVTVVCGRMWVRSKGTLAVYSEMPSESKLNKAT